MRLPVVEKNGCLCERCVALCCRYFALEIDKPETKREFEDLRWYLLHEDTQIFVEEGEWYLQVNRKCRALLPDNRCGIYENRPSICREYNTTGCDWHADAYDYELMFTEPEQLERYMHEYLRKKRQARRKKAVKGRKHGGGVRTATRAKRKGAYRRRSSTNRTPGANNGTAGVRRALPLLESA
jgi:Fe-S-cluster containining protein